MAVNFNRRCNDFDGLLMQCDHRCDSAAESNALDLLTVYAQNQSDSRFVPLLTIFHVKAM